MGLDKDINDEFTEEDVRQLVIHYRDRCNNLHLMTKDKFIDLATEVHNMEINNPKLFEAIRSYALAERYPWLKTEV